MSGFIALLHTDGAPVDPAQLKVLTDSMTVHGPDAGNCRHQDNVGLGHALLRTTFEAAAEQQPYSLDGRVWIVADARVDGRLELADQLRRNGRLIDEGATDCELILHAYHLWSEACAQHLLGDFSFVIWDHPNRKLIAIRDHFGVVPLYYARTPDRLIVSNTLNCIRRHPAVSTGINDPAIADFLLFGHNRNPETTSWTDIHRVPPASTLTWTPDQMQLQRYWQIPVTDPVCLPRANDYIERFQQLFEQAVSDRLRTRQVAVSMSGGLDSTSVALVAHRILQQRQDPFELRAHTHILHKYGPDEEQPFAERVADALGIPIKFYVADLPGENETAAYANPDSRYALRPEPAYLPSPGDPGDRPPIGTDFSRVVLKGFGGDTVLATSDDGWRILWRQCGLGALLGGLMRFIHESHRLPPLSIRSRIRKRLGKGINDTPFPDWIADDFASHWNLRQQWSLAQAPQPSPHPTYPKAYNSLSSPFWTALFERQHPGFKSARIEYRHPFFDVRLVEFLLSIPPAPWCHDKLLLRQAMRGQLPEMVRRRPKTPLARSPLYQWLRHDQGLDFLIAIEGVDRYLNLDRLRLIAPNPGRRNIHAISNAYALAYWLRHHLRTPPAT